MVEKLNFQEMLSYMRPWGSRHQTKFCNRYLRPVFGQPDKHGNYIKIIGDKPRVSFMAHHDTVHTVSGRSKVVLNNGFYTVEGANCLGADCTTGVYIILKMIEAGIEGVYVVHQAEESGCIGSKALVKSNPDWLKHVDFAISFDRKGYNSIITHQMGMRTCSNMFADSLASILDMDYVADSTGVYTDSNEYADIVSECTNISVGYFNQHGKNESQDKVFLDMLVEKILVADWSKLISARDPAESDYLWNNYGNSTYSTFGANGWETKSRTWNYDNWNDDTEYEDKESKEEHDYRDLLELVRESPAAIAKILHDLGYNAYDLIDEIQDYEAEIRTPKRGFR